MSEEQTVWELTAPAAPKTGQLSEDRSTDVLIIGGGFTGLSTALHLESSGLDITLIEARSIGWGASGRNGGHVVPLIKKNPAAIIAQLGDEQGRRLIRMVAASAAGVFSLIERYQIPCAAERNGWLHAVHSRRVLPAVENMYQDWQQHGADVEMLDAGQVSALMGSDAYTAALLFKDGGHINPLAYTRGLAAAALHQGVAIFTDTPAMNIERVNKRWQVTTPRGVISAAKVVLATAAYSDNLWPGLKKSFLPFYLYNAVTTPLDPGVRATVLPGRQPVTDTRGDAHVFHYDGEGRLVTGGTFIFPLNWKRRLLTHARQVIAGTFPQLEDFQFEPGTTWRGKLAMTTDLLPHVHILAPGLYSWIGCNGRGIALSTSMGSLLADAVNEVEPRDWAMQPVDMQAITMHSLSSLMTSVALGYFRMRDKIM